MARGRHVVADEKLAGVVCEADQLLECHDEVALCICSFG